MKTQFKNANLFCENDFKPHDLFVDGPIISAPCAPDNVVDCEGCFLVPGLIDMHIHGAAGVEFSDAASLETMARFLLKNGVTGFCPTSLSAPESELICTYEDYKLFESAKAGGMARTLGINMEGPFFAPERRGAHLRRHLRALDMDLFLRLYRASGDRIAVVSISPELKGAADFAAALHDFCAVSAAHSEATYSQMREFYARGGKLLTHLYNAMPPLLSREPGVIGAAFEKAQFASLICDGHHVHKAAVRAAFQLFYGRICLISDAMAACGMPDGSYHLGESAVTVKDKKATLRDGTLAGGATTLLCCVQKAVEFGVPLHSAIRAATVNPAKAIGAFARVGSLAGGKQANFLLLGENSELRAVYLEGELQKI